MIEINNKRLCPHCFTETNDEICPNCSYSKKTYRYDPLTLPSGSILMGRYIVGKVIGKGGFGITYLAYDNKLDKKIAIKEYFPNGLAQRVMGNPTIMVSSQEDAETFRTGAERFYREAQTLSRFNGNPAIVNVYEFFYENCTAYFTMEFLEGMSLKKYIDKNGALSVEKAAYIADQVSFALLSAHSGNILHRDISPDNIIICDNGRIKLIDFGAARQFTAEGTKSLSVLIKPGFTPIEQYQSKGKQGPFTDIYSLGATIYYCLTKDVMDDPMSRLDDDSEFTANSYGINPNFFEFIKKCTAIKGVDRYADMFLFRKALQETGINPEPIIVPEAPDEDNVKGKVLGEIVTFSGGYTGNTGNLPDSSMDNVISASGNVDKTSTAPNNFNTASAVNTANNANAVIKEEKAAESKPKKGILGAIIGIAAVLVVGIVAISVVASGVFSDDNDIDVEEPRVTTTTEDDSEPAGNLIVETTKSATLTTTLPPATTKATTTKATTTTAKTTKKTTTSKKTTTTSGTRKPIPGLNPDTSPAPAIGEITTTPFSSETTTVPTTQAPVTTTTKAPVVTTTTTTTAKTTKKTTAATKEKTPDEVKIGGRTYSTSATELDLSRKHLTDDDIENLKYMKKLKILNISNNNLSDLSVLKNCTALEELNAENNGVSDISFVSSLKNLKILVMNFNYISDISVLANFSTLEKIWLCNNYISDISPIRYNTKLVELGFNNNTEIGDVSAVRNMDKLRNLQLENCGITDITAIGGCYLVGTLNLSHNNINDFSALKKMGNLYDVNLRNTCVMTQEVATTLFGVKVRNLLDISDNDVSETIVNQICGSISGGCLINYQNYN